MLPFSQTGLYRPNTHHSLGQLTRALLVCMPPGVLVYHTVSVCDSGVVRYAGERRHKPSTTIGNKHNPRMHQTGDWNKLGGSRMGRLLSK